MAALASVLCEDDQTTKTKRKASIGSFSYAASDVSKYDGSHVKTLNLLKSVNVPSDVRSSFDHLALPMETAMGKTTVEFWPPDMDKQKFYSSLMQDDNPIQLWPMRAKPEAYVRINKPSLPENLPDIPLNQASPEIPDFQTITESIEDFAVTNRAPVVFPTSEPTTKSPEQAVAFVTRNGNKKRKLKKKVKAVTSVETLPTTPVPDSVIEITPSIHNHGAPIYETIDEPFIDIFKPIRYTDIISNLSNLTEMTFGAKNASKWIEIIDSDQPINNFPDEFNPTIAFNVSDFYNNSESVITLSSTQGYNELMPLDMMLNELRQAIDDRDVRRIKSIVQLIEDPKEETVTAMMESKNVTEAATTATPTTNTSVEVSTLKLEPTTLANKVYLAPRVRNQRKFKQLKTKITPADSTPSSIEKDQESSDIKTTVTEMMNTNMSSAKLKSTTEKMMMSSVESTSLKATAKGRRSHITPRTRIVTKSSRKVVKTIRRIGRVPV